MVFWDADADAAASFFEGSFIQKRVNGGAVG